MPSDELVIICGSNANNDEPTKEHSWLKNLLQRKYTGIIVITEIIIEEKRCNSIKKNGSSSFVLENRIDKNMGHPLLVKKYVSDNGKIISSKITSVSYNKQRKLTREIKKAKILGLIWWN